MKLWIKTALPAALISVMGAAWASSGLPDPAKLYQARANCHNAYDLITDDLDKRRSVSAADEAWARAHENAGNAGKPCTAPPPTLAARANNRALSTSQGIKAART